MTFLPAVAEARYEGGYRMRIRFNDGAEDVVDFRQWLSGPVLEPLLDVAFFRRFFIDGGTVTWPNGADIAPETLYAAIHSAAKARP
jgi:hypothetical protein